MLGALTLGLLVSAGPPVSPVEAAATAHVLTQFERVGRATRRLNWPVPRL